MRPIHKFILHIVHNWKNELNEAYSEGAIKKFIEKFREESDDLNIKITDDQLKIYIQRFDILKNSPKIQEKDLNKWSISQLIKLVTASKGAEEEEKEEDTPDVVYNDNGITIWNGSKEDNCIRYGNEKWCITRGSFGNYRYNADKGYPVFYLAKNANISDSDKLSFVAIQVRDVEDENKKYVYTDRSNSPYESSAMNFNALLSKIPWLNDIPNIRGILRYIPLNNNEKVNQKYKNESVSIREWIKMPFNTKKQYLVVRSGRSLFNDIENTEFVGKYLPQYSQIAEFIVITPGIIDNVYLLSNLDKFSNQDRRSITANIQQPIDLKYLSTENFPFDVKKLLTLLNKWDIKSNERLYVTKDGEAIVKLIFRDTVSVGVYTAEDDYPNIKLNQRTSKYLLDYPELDKIPFNVMIKLATDGVIDRSLLNTVIEKAKTDENSAIVVKEIDSKEIIVDSNSFASYKVENGKITKIPFDDEDVQKIFNDSKDNESFQQNAVNLVKTSVEENENLPPTLDKNAFYAVLNSTPYNKRTVQINDGSYILLPIEDQNQILAKNINEKTSLSSISIGDNSDWRQIGGRYTKLLIKKEIWEAYFAYLRNENQIYNDDELIRTLREGYGTVAAKKAFIDARPPLSPTGRYATAVGTNGIYYIINKQNPRESFKISDTSGKLIKANIPPSLARQLTGATPDQATPVAIGAGQAVAAPIGPRRGRPAGVPNAPAAPAAAAGGYIDVGEVMEETGLGPAFSSLPRIDYRRLNVDNATRVDPNGDRGAARRNNQLGAAGSVGRVISVGPSKIYIIRLTNSLILASINIQPGNRNYLLLPNGTMVTLNSPSDLMAALRQRNLAEIRRYLTQEYLANNPEHLEEVRGLLQQHIAETRNQ